MMVRIDPSMHSDEPQQHRQRAQTDEELREHRRRRIRRHGRRAYIRSVYFLPSLATLGNAICGFAAIYVAGLDPADGLTRDLWTLWWAKHAFLAAGYLLFLAMFFDAIDGRLARFTRHTTDFGGQLDSLADVISFGVAPSFLALQVVKVGIADYGVPAWITRVIWVIGTIYMACAAIRLARFNVSNEHGEQHHFSFLGLPSPGAGAAVAAFVILQQDLHHRAEYWPALEPLANACLWMLPVIVLVTGLLMVSNLRYPHVVNRWLRGRRSIGRLVLVVAVVLLVVVAHRYVLAAATLVYALWGLTAWLLVRFRRWALPQSAGPSALPPPPPST